MSSKHKSIILFFVIIIVVAAIFLFVCLSGNDPFVPANRISVVGEGLINCDEYEFDLAIDQLKFSFQPLICYKITDENEGKRIDFWIFKEEPDEKLKNKYKSLGYKFSTSKNPRHGDVCFTLPVEDMGYNGTDVYINGKVNTGRITISPRIISESDTNASAPETDPNSK